ncbi:MAG: Gfo/Idh/MocA family oxidoreductase [Verrucomicrobiales bacterium]|nr:Gfo/Idh/MocA family oxidoreductase [Verrucomicrobiales bacterium]
MVRIGIIGCGRILAAHLEGYKILREAGVEFEITALCSRKAEDARSYVKRGKGPPQRKAVSNIPGDPLAVGDQYLSDFQPEVDVEIFTDYEEMIKNGPVDAINDFTVHSLHHQIALLAFRHGKHILTQKPLAVTMEGARQMCHAAENAGVTFSVFENLRFVPFVRHHGWAFSDDGPAGNLQIALMGNVGTWWAPDLIVAETPWRHELIQGGGITLDLGPHFFDMIRYIGGGEIKSISGQTEVVEATRYILRNGEKVDPVSCDADDTFYASFTTESGASGTMFGSWSGRGTKTTVADGPVFYGSKARVSGDEIHIEGAASPESLSEKYEQEASPETKAKHFPFGMTNDFALAQYDWLQAVANGIKPECSGKEGLMDLAAAYAVVESSLAGRRVDLKEIVTGSLRDYQKPIDQGLGL